MSRGYTYLVTLVDYPAEVGEKDGQHLLVGGGQQVDQAMHLQVGGEEGQQVLRISRTPTQLQHPG